MIVVRTTASPDDGVLGLNGWWYLLDGDNLPQKFATVELARGFVADGGGDPDDESIEYQEEIDIQEDLDKQGYA